MVRPAFHAGGLPGLLRRDARRSCLDPGRSCICRTRGEKNRRQVSPNSGYPCASHFTMVVGDLLGESAPMDGRVPIPGGRHVKSGEQRGIVFDESPEALAFIRWQRGDFIALERLYASGFRRALATLNLTTQRDVLHSFGINHKIVKSLADAKA